MIGLFDRLAQPFLRTIDPEQAHRLTVQGLKLAQAALPSSVCRDDARLAVSAFGIDFPNPIGMAAGFDKNAEVPDALLNLGFGFVEVGTVTPRPQAGNPRPRIFRLPDDDGVINRLGFNNDGEDSARARLVTRAARAGIVGVNIGANRDAADRVADYARLAEIFAPLARYITVNISSPNTPGLRDLQDADSLDLLLARVVEARDKAAVNSVVKPVLVKIAPDLSLTALDALIAVIRNRKIDGVIVSNTTITRPESLREKAKAKEQGGLSGRPVFPLSTRMLAETYMRVGGAFPLIGVGGIDSGASALAKIKAGASLIQLYTGLVYRGIGLIPEIKSELLNAMAGGARLSDFVGQDASRLVADPWPA